MSSVVSEFASKRQRIARSFGSYVYTTDSAPVENMKEATRESCSEQVQ